MGEINRIDDAVGCITDLGEFRGTHHPTSISEHMSRTRGENWRDTTAFLFANCILAFGWLVWADAFKF